MNWGCREMERRKYDREFKLEVLRLIQEGKRLSHRLPGISVLEKISSTNGKGLSGKNRRIPFQERATLEKMRPMCVNWKRTSNELPKNGIS